MLTVQPSELVRLKMVVSHGMTTGVKVVATVRNSAKETPREVELWSTPGIVVDEPVTVSSADGQVAFYASGKVLVMFMSEARKLDMSHANIMTLIDAEGSQREGLTRRDGSLYWVKGPTEDYCS